MRHRSRQAHGDGGGARRSPDGVRRRRHGPRAEAGRLLLLHLAPHPLRDDPGRGRLRRRADRVREAGGAHVARRASRSSSSSRAARSRSWSATSTATASTTRRSRTRSPPAGSARCARSTASPTAGRRTCCRTSSTTRCGSTTTPAPSGSWPRRRAARSSTDAHASPDYVGGFVQYENGVRGVYECGGGAPDVPEVRALVGQEPDRRHRDRGLRRGLHRQRLEGRDARRASSPATAS